MSNYKMEEKDPLEIGENFLLNEQLLADKMKLERLKQRCKMAQIRKNNIILPTCQKMKKRRDPIKINIVECTGQEMERIRQNNFNTKKCLKVIAVNKIEAPAITHLNIQPVASTGERNNTQYLDIDPLTYLNHVNLIREKFLEPTNNEEENSSREILDVIDLTV